MKTASNAIWIKKLIDLETLEWISKKDLDIFVFPPGLEKLLEKVWS